MSDPAEPARRPTRRIRRPLALIVSLLALASSGLFHQQADRPRRGNSIRLSVMTFNIREGGVHGQFPAVIEAIRASGADVVGLQEPFGRARRIATALGWYAAPALHTISRYPIVQPQDSRDRYGWLVVSPGEIVTIANIHNPSYPYGPTLVLGGRSIEDVLANERRGRLRWMRPFLDALEPALAADQPVFFTGDFNSPSWRDWTPADVDALGWQPSTVEAKGPRYPVQWPASLEMEAAGFRDSYRDEHPDPVADPGYTWTPGHPHVGRHDVFDRIDFVWAAGPSKTLSSRVVGDTNPVTDLVVEPWPSDHRAVVSAFRVTPAEAPTFAAPTDVRLVAGAPTTVAYHATGSDRTVGLWPVGADPAVTGPAASLSLDDAPSRGQRNFDTTGVPAGAYDFVLLVGGAVRSRVPVTVVDDGAKATIATDRAAYPARRADRGVVDRRAGQPIRLAVGEPRRGFAVRRTALGVDVHRRPHRGIRADRPEGRPGGRGRVRAEPVAVAAGRVSGAPVRRRRLPVPRGEHAVSRYGLTTLTRRSRSPLRSFVRAGRPAPSARGAAVGRTTARGTPRAAPRRSAARCRAR